MDNNLKDKILICVDCKEEFAFTIAAQTYFADRGFTEAPKRCRSCYADYKRKAKTRTNGKPHRGLPVDVEFEDERDSIPEVNMADAGSGKLPEFD